MNELPFIVLYNQFNLEITLLIDNNIFKIFLEKKPTILWFYS